MLQVSREVVSWHIQTWLYVAAFVLVALAPNCDVQKTRSPHKTNGG